MKGFVGLFAANFSLSEVGLPGKLTVILLILLSVAGCARFRPGPAPLAETEKFEVLSRYRKTLQHLPDCPGFEADVRLRYRSLLQDVQLAGVMLAKNPDSLKVLGLSPLGQPLLLLAVQDSRFTFVDVHGEKGYAGSLASRKAREVLPMEKLVEEGLYPLLTGAPGIPGDDRMVVASLDPAGQGSYLLTWPEQGDHRKQVVFRPATGEIEAFRMLDAAGRLLLEVGYDAPRDQRCGVPKVIRISGTGARGTAECSFEQVFVAESLPESAFQLAVPEGFAMEEVR